MHINPCKTSTYALFIFLKRGGALILRQISSVCKRGRGVATYNPRRPRQSPPPPPRGSSCRWRSCPAWMPSPPEHRRPPLQRLPPRERMLSRVVGEGCRWDGCGGALVLSRHARPSFPLPCSSIPFAPASPWALRPSFLRTPFVVRFPFGRLPPGGYQIWVVEFM